jgi:hypothetical protein
MISFHIPQDKDLLAAFGECALRHEHMNYILKMTIKSLADITIEEALAATKYEGSRQLRMRIKKLAKQKLGEGTPLLKIQAIMNNCEQFTNKRNDFVHGLWVSELDGDAYVRDDFGNNRLLPTVQELTELADEIKKLTNELNVERLEGFLHQALSERKKLDKKT